MNLVTSTKLQPIFVRNYGWVEMARFDITGCWRQKMIGKGKIRKTTTGSNNEKLALIFRKLPHRRFIFAFFPQLKQYFQFLFSPLEKNLTFCHSNARMKNEKYFFVQHYTCMPILISKARADLLWILFALPLRI